MRATNTAIAAASLSPSLTSKDPRQSGTSVFGCTADTIFTSTQSTTTIRYAFLNGSSGVITRCPFYSSCCHSYSAQITLAATLPSRHPPQPITFIPCQTTGHGKHSPPKGTFLNGTHGHLQSLAAPINGASSIHAPIASLRSAPLSDPIRLAPALTSARHSRAIPTVKAPDSESTLPLALGFRA
jgi:hypothetical protein